MSIDSNDFRRVLGHFPTGVTVVTGAGADGPAGMAIGSFSSVSLDPPLVLFCPGKTSATWATIKATGSFCVNVLAADQEALSGLFAGKSEDKFATIDWTTATTGSPVIPGAIAWIDCELHAIHDGGDHEIVVGLVKALESTPAADSGPLLFFQSRYGHYLSFERS